MEVSIFIFRRDLRTSDNLAFNRLLSQGANILPIFIFNPQQIYATNNAYYSNNAVQFMIESLRSLEKQVHINYYEGNDIDVLNNIKKNYSIKMLGFNRDYTPYAINRDTAIIEWCRANDINVITAEDYTLLDMGTLVNKSGKPYQVFTPFYKAALNQTIHKPLASPNMRKTTFVKSIHKFDKDKYYTGNPDIAVRGGREEALKRLKMKFNDYSKKRDYPAMDRTTKLSAYIKFGCVSIREVYDKLKKNKSVIRELFWREFYANILYNFPHVLGKAFKTRYNKIKWTNNKHWFDLWCQGKTGFPLVDAGMLQLNKTGWMHNRVRMVVAMFLTKDLLIDWRWGEKYFATKLIDYDPASNNGGWQWSASTGTDSQPYFRIFNPDTQLKKYDKNYEYVKRWNPDWATKTPIVDHKIRSKIAIKTFANL
jgi:deoxyribodipyrimidine photo-lyase